ncbi:MAG: hypothetical protein IJZ87_07680 [Bacteroidales bacterium]|nr:hypothetical protein [Bacteroidales bacterium]
MKKILVLLSFFSLFAMSSCNHSSDMSDKIIGDWETIHIREKGDYDGYYYDESYEVTPDVIEEWYVISINKLFMKITETNDEDIAGIANIPCTYTFKDDQLTSLLLNSDNTSTVTVSFTDDDTMIFYMDDSGYTDGIYETYEQWTTYRRVK